MDVEAFHAAYEPSTVTACAGDSSDDVDFGSLSWLEELLDDQMIAQQHDLSSPSSSDLAVEKGVDVNLPDANRPSGLYEVTRTTLGGTKASLLREPPKKNAHRERVKSELGYLRQKATELEHKLTALRHGVLYSEYSSATPFLQATPMWKGISERQLIRRRQAEAENKRLRLLLNTQRALAAQIEQDVRARLADHAAAPSLSRSELQLLQFMPVDALLYQKYLSELDDLYAQTDAVLKAANVTTLMDKTRRTTVIPHSDGEKTHASVFKALELVDVDCVPFPWQHAAKAMWQSIQLHDHKHGRLRFHAMLRPQDTRVVKFRLHCLTDASLICHMVTRKYTTADRIVGVWRMLIQGEQELAGMVADETGWIVAFDDPRWPSQRTIAQTYERIVPRSTRKAKVPRSDIEKFIDLYLSTIDEDVFEIWSLMESLLLDEMTGIRGTC